MWYYIFISISESSWRCFYSPIAVVFRSTLRQKICNQTLPSWPLIYLPPWPPRPPKPRTNHPLASRYTDWATPTQRTLYEVAKQTCHFTFSVIFFRSAGRRQKYTQTFSASSIDSQTIILFRKECVLITRLAEDSYWREHRPQPFKWRLIEDLQSEWLHVFRYLGAIIQFGG